MDFESLGLAKIYAARLSSKGLVSPTVIQSTCFESIVSGRSIMGLAKTGTGKTLAFLAPLAERLNRNQPNSPGAIVILLPTRELALQVEESLQILLEDPRQSVVMVGGQSEQTQLEAAQKAVWWIATPGRFLDLLKRNLLPNIERLECVVLDEADRLLDMGFLEDIRAIFKLLPSTKQALFFSATLHLGVEEMAFELGFDFEKKGVAQKEATSENLDHSVVFLGENEKFQYLVSILHEFKDFQAIVFSNYKEKARKIASRLKGLGAKAECLNADLAQNQRIQIVEGFKAGRIRYLVASDLAARGLDIEGLDLVINFDLPEDPAIYVHRVGRTARAGKLGKALSFVGFDDAYCFERLEKYLGKKIPQVEINSAYLSAELKNWALPPRVPQRHSTQKTSFEKSHSRPKNKYQGAAKSEFLGEGIKKSTVMPSFFQRCLNVLKSIFGVKSSISENRKEARPQNFNAQKSSTHQPHKRKRSGKYRSKNSYSRSRGGRRPSSSPMPRSSSGRGPSGSSK